MPPTTNLKLKTNGVKVNKELSLDTCDEIITPDCLRALYNFHYTPHETEKNTFGIGTSVAGRSQLYLEVAVSGIHTASIFGG
jgi:hypothetical protein